MTRDVVLPFVFEHIPVRGAIVQLSDTWADLRQHQDYSPTVSSTLGEAAAATTLIAQSLKSESSVTLQISGKGPLSMLVMQVTSELDVRGLASAKDAADGLLFPQLVRGGHCAITVDHPKSEQPYQGIVDVSGDSLAACLETYFARSAQIPSHLTLRADADTCGGILLQQMPGRDEASEDDWRRLGLMAETLAIDELTDGVEASLLGRLFAEDDVRVFRGRATAFRCRCSRARAANVLKLLGADECREASAEQGAVVVTCEYCGRRQSFDAVDIAELFADASASHSDSVH